MAEIAFEQLLFATEAAAGTDETVPDQQASFLGINKPGQSVSRPEESSGLLAATTRQNIIKKWNTLEGEGDLDIYLFNFFLNNIFAPSPTAVAAGTGFDWTSVRNMTAYDPDGRAFTVWNGDPAVQIRRAPFGMLSELKITWDANSDEGVKMSLAGQTQQAAGVAAPALPTVPTSPIFSGINVDVWFDTSLSQTFTGTELLVARVISGEITIPNNISYKYLAAGAGATALSFSDIGIGKSSPMLRLTLEWPDNDEITLYDDLTPFDFRVTLYGPVIGVGPERFEIEFTGTTLPVITDMGENASTNRTLVFELMCEYDATIASDLQIRVRNDQNTI